MLVFFGNTFLSWSLLPRRDGTMFDHPSDYYPLEILVTVTALLKACLKSVIGPMFVSGVILQYFVAMRKER